MERVRGQPSRTPLEVPDVWYAWFHSRIDTVVAAPAGGEVTSPEGAVFQPVEAGAYAAEVGAPPAGDDGAGAGAVVVGAAVVGAVGGTVLAGDPPAEPDGPVVGVTAEPDPPDVEPGLVVTWEPPAEPDGTLVGVSAGPAPVPVTYSKAPVRVATSVGSVTGHTVRFAHPAAWASTATTRVLSLSRSTTCAGWPAAVTDGYRGNPDPYTTRLPPVVGAARGETLTMVIPDGDGVDVDEGCGVTGRTEPDRVEVVVVAAAVVVVVAEPDPLAVGGVDGALVVVLVVAAGDPPEPPSPPDPPLVVVAVLEPREPLDVPGAVGEGAGDPPDPPDGAVVGEEPTVVVDVTVRGDGGGERRARHRHGAVVGGGG